MTTGSRTGHRCSCWPPGWPRAARRRPRRPACARWSRRCTGTGGPWRRSTPRSCALATLAAWTGRLAAWTEHRARGSRGRRLRAGPGPRAAVPHPAAPAQRGRPGADRGPDRGPPAGCGGRRPGGRAGRSRAGVLLRARPQGAARGRDGAGYPAPGGRHPGRDPGHPQLPRPGHRRGARLRAGRGLRVRAGLRPGGGGRGRVIRVPGGVGRAERDGRDLPAAAAASRTGAGQGAGPAGRAVRRGRRPRPGPGQPRRPGGRARAGGRRAGRAAARAARAGPHAGQAGPGPGRGQCAGGGHGHRDRLRRPDRRARRGPGPGRPVMRPDQAAGPAYSPGTLVAALRHAAAAWPDRVAWIFDPGGEFTFADVDRRSAGFARALADPGVRPGDRIAVMITNQPAFPLTWLALARLGAVMVPVNTRYQTADAEHVLRACQASGIVAGSEFEPLLRRLPADVPALRHLYPSGAIAAAADSASASALAGDWEPGPGDTANIQFTSGTTGHPKGCVLPHRYWTQLAGGLVTEFPYLTAGDVMLTAQAFHYIDPQWNVAASLLSGAELVILDGFHPSSFWDKVREHRVSYFYCLGAMPTLLRRPAAPRDREHAVRVVQCSAIPKDLHRELEERWGVPWYEAFGMTETGADLRVTELDHDELVGP